MKQISCERIALHYELLEHLAFGKLLEQQRFAFLSHASTVERALECGGGDGRFVCRLLEVNPNVEVDFVDLSPAMVKLAEKRVGKMGVASRSRVRFCVGDIRDFRPRAEGYDLMVTHFFLDWFEEAELSEIVKLLASWLSHNALWMVSDFQEAADPIRGLWSRGIIRCLYAVFRVATGLRVKRMPKYASLLERQALKQGFRSTSFGDLLYSSVWQECDRTSFIAYPSQIPAGNPEITTPGV